MPDSLVRYVLATKVVFKRSHTQYLDVRQLKKSYVALILWKKKWAISSYWGLMNTIFSFVCVWVCDHGSNRTLESIFPKFCGQGPSVKNLSRVRLWKKIALNRFKTVAILRNKILRTAFFFLQQSHISKSG